MDQAAAESEGKFKLRARVNAFRRMMRDPDDKETKGRFRDPASMVT
jgi:hypothetical protein